MLCSKKKINFYETDLISASFVKYSINSFLALKVAFFNQLYDLISPNNHDDWTNIIKMISHDSRIGNSHLQVPGLDGKRGFGWCLFFRKTLLP